MRIGFVVPGYSQNVAEWAIPALQRLVEAVAGVHGVVVFSLRYPAGGVYPFPTYPHYATGGGQKGKLASFGIWWRTVRQIVQLHRQEPFDLLHAFWADEPGLVAGLAGKLINRPVITSSGGGEFVYLPDINYGTQGSAFRRWVIRTALKLSDVVTGGSHYQVGLARQHVDYESKVRFAPLGVDVGLFVPAGGNKSSTQTREEQTFQVSETWKVAFGRDRNLNRPLTLVQAASLTPIKNQHLLLEVLAKVREIIPEAQLRIAGDGPLKAELQAYADQLGVGSAVIWHGEVPFTNMPAIYQQADMYVQTSHHESQGMAVLEAMACGVPVVGTQVGVVKRVGVGERGAGIGDRVVRLVQGDGYRVACWQAREIVEKEFSLAVVVQNFLGMYASLTE